MTSKQRKTWLIAGLAILATLAGLWFLAVAPQLKARSAAATETDTARQAAVTANQNADTLETKAQDLATLVEDGNQLTSAFPNDYQQGEWIAMMYDAADDAGVTIALVTPSVPADPATRTATGTYTPVAPPVAPIPGQATTTTPEAAAAQPPAVAPAPAPTTPPAPGTGENLSGAATPEQFTVAASAVQIEATGTAEEMVNFLRELENLDRPILLSQLKLSGGDGGVFTATLSGSTYLTRPLEVPEEYQP